MEPNVSQMLLGVCVTDIMCNQMFQRVSKLHCFCTNVDIG